RNRNFARAPLGNGRRCPALVVGIGRQNVSRARFTSARDSIVCRDSDKRHKSNNLRDTKVANIAAAFPSFLGHLCHAGMSQRIRVPRDPCPYDSTEVTGRDFIWVRRRGRGGGGRG